MTLAELNLMIDGEEKDSQVVILKGALLSGNLPQIEKCVDVYRSLLETAEGKYKSYQIIHEVKEE